MLKSSICSVDHIKAVLPGNMHTRCWSLLTLGEAVGVTLYISLTHTWRTSSLTRSHFLEARIFPSAQAGGKRSAWHAVRHSNKELFRREQLGKTEEVSGGYILHSWIVKNTLNQNVTYLPSKLVKASFNFQDFRLQNCLCLVLRLIKTWETLTLWTQFHLVSLK